MNKFIFKIFLILSTCSVEYVFCQPNCQKKLEILSAFNNADITFSKSDLLDTSFKVCLMNFYHFDLSFFRNSSLKYDKKIPNSILSNGTFFKNGFNYIFFVLYLRQSTQGEEILIYRYAGNKGEYILTPKFNLKRNNLRCVLKEIKLCKNFCGSVYYDSIKLPCIPFWR